MKTDWFKRQVALLIVFVLIFDNAQAKWLDSTFLNRFTYHFQLTTVSQWHPDFKSPYGGNNSLVAHEGIATSVTSTIFLGMKLWKGGELYFNPEMAAGGGLSGAVGVAGFVNGETVRVGNPAPSFYVARGFLKQTFCLSKEYETIEDDENQVATTTPKKYVSFSFGKFSMGDFFDDNAGSHDPRKQFMNWSLMSNGAWDYPANTRGYTFGVEAEYRYFDWTLRAATSLMPTTANGPTLDWNWTLSNSETVELERRYSIAGRKGVIRALGFFTSAYMGSYKQAILLDSLNIVATRKYSRTKAGFGLSWEQEALPYFTAFARASYNDGQNETFAFTEIDNSISGGVAITGHKWGRNDDVVGFAMVTNGISKAHQNYLAAGGYGFIIGDGKLNYGREFIMELYYACKPFKKWLWISPDYQFVLHPGYNKDRGPANVIGLRLHVGI